jgi:hypothetical protein
MGVNTWAAFAGANDNAVVDGDFAVSETELASVLKELRAGGIDIVAIHHHMVGENPRILFLHYWGRGKAVDLATTVRKALDLTAWEGKSKGAAQGGRGQLASTGATQRDQSVDDQHEHRQEHDYAVKRRATRKCHHACCQGRQVGEHLQSQVNTRG